MTTKYVRGLREIREQNRMAEMLKHMHPRPDDLDAFATALAVTLNQAVPSPSTKTKIETVVAHAEHLMPDASNHLVKALRTVASRLDRAADLIDEAQQHHRKEVNE